MSNPTPAIMRWFHVRLTRKQSAQFRREWRKYGENEGAMCFVQPQSEWGPFDITYGSLRCAILDKKLACAISKTMARHRKARPA